MSTPIEVKSLELPMENYISKAKGQRFRQEEITALPERRLNNMTSCCKHSRLANSNK